MTLCFMVSLKECYTLTRRCTIVQEVIHTLSIMQNENKSLFRIESIGKLLKLLCLTVSALQTMEALLLLLRFLLLLQEETNMC